MKILVVITTAFTSTGGLTTVMMNYYRAMNKEGLKIDFASTNVPSQSLLDEIHVEGSEYYQLPPRHCRCKTRKRGSGSCGTASGCG